jgi:hypothetical protein
VTTESAQKDLDPSLADEAVAVPDAPLSSVGASEPVTEAKLRAILARPEMQQRLRENSPQVEQSTMDGSRPMMPFNQS